MATLASGTYWLVRNSQNTKPSNTAVEKKHEPDYFMREFSVKVFDIGGRIKSEIIGAEGRHFPDNDTLEIEKAHIRLFNPKGQLTVATADRALSNGDGSEVQLFGNAVVTRHPISSASGAKLEFKSDFLHAFMDTEQVKSNLPVTITRGADKFTGDGMNFDNLDQIINLQGRVRGTLTPVPTR